MQRWVGFALVAIAVVIVIFLINSQSSSKTESVASLTLIIIGALSVLIGMLALVGIGYKLANIANPSEAFALPSGSIRAVLALLITVGFIILSFPGATQTAPSTTQTTTSPTQTTTSNTQTTTSPTQTTTSNTHSTPPGTQTPPTPEKKKSAFLTLIDTSAYAAPPPGSAAGNGSGSANNQDEGNKSKSDSAEPKSLLQILGALMTTIVGFYFGSKSATEAVTKVSEAIKNAK